MREQLKALIAGWKSRASEQQTVRAITLRGCADDLQALLVADVGGWRPATPTPGAAAMTEHTLAEMIERRSETCDIAERAWRGDPTNNEIWESMNLAKCRLADVVQGNLPAILTALRRPEPGPRPEADEGAVAAADLGQHEREGLRWIATHGNPYRSGDPARPWWTTLVELKRLGLVDADNNLTDAGRAALAAAQEGS